MQCIDVHGQLSHPGLDIGYEGDPHVATKRGIKQSAKKDSAANLPAMGRPGDGVDRRNLRGMMYSFRAC
jgi:hypothetical protein